MVTVVYCGIPVFAALQVDDPVMCERICGRECVLIAMECKYAL